MGYDLADFERDVLIKSREIPVLVDFWAPWCGPCKVLGPVLEKLASQAAGRWQLVKVNTEDNKELAMAFDIRSIPAVKLFHDGEVIDEFVGALPEGQIRQWLQKALPSPGKNLLKEAREALGKGDRAEACRIAEEVLAAEPGNPDALGIVAEAALLSSPQKALDAARAVPADAEAADRANAVAVLAEALVRGTNAAQWPAGKAQEDLLAGLQLLGKGEFGAAFPRFIAVVARDRSYAEQAAQKLCRAIIQLLGLRHPDVEANYRAFSSALNS